MFNRILAFRACRMCNKTKGFALIESLVGLTIFAILGLAFANSMMVGHKLRQRMIHRSAALQVATDEMERQTRLRATSLTAGTTTTTITKGNMRFQRVVSIVSAGNGGYTVTVTVSDLNLTITGSVQLKNTLVPYGSA